MKEEKIISKDNEKIKLLKKLNQKKYRNQHDKFFVENYIIINDSVSAGIFPENLFVTKSFFDKNKENVSMILEKSGLDTYYLIDDKINKSFSNLDTAPGICAVYKKDVKEINFDKSVLYLNNISDPGNLGTILRSALAFDFSNIVLDEYCVDLYNPKTVSAARDAILKLNISFDKDLKMLKDIKKKMKVFSTDVTKGKSVNAITRQELFCIVFGNEANGVSDDIKKISDNFIKINMSKNIESLNVASSVAIVLHEIYNS